MSKILLKDRLDFLYGFSVRVNDETNGKYPVYGSNGITGYIDNFKIEGPGVIIGRKGTVGAINFSSGNYTPTDTAYYVSLKNSKQDDIKFWYYYLQLLGLNKLNTHSSVPGLSREIAYFINVNPPDFTNQQKIANVLSSIDIKIKLNNRINAELEAMAKTLYDYWFVQFDFPDKTGKPYKTSGGKMVWNEELKRDIPEGWEVKTLGNIESNIVTGKTPPTNNVEFYNGEVPFITIGDIRGNMHIIDTEMKLSQAGADFQKNKYIPKGSLCVTCIASPGLIGFATQNSQTNQQINSIIIQNEENRTYLYYALNDYFKFSKGAKTGNTFSNMNKGDFEAINLLHPPKDLIYNFEKVAKPFVEQILIFTTENLKLSELRDWLLPMLMNGQVRVR